MQKIYLICHGATVADTQHLYCGRSDLPLSPEGEDTLRRMASAGGYPAAEGCRLMTSGMQRTEQTLKILYGEKEHERRPDFRELDYGAFELQSKEQLSEREDYRAWINGDTAHDRCPDGESGEDVANRIRPAFEEILRDGRDTILITHSGIIASLLIDLYPDDLNSRKDWQPDPGKGWAVTLEDGKPVKCEAIPDAFLGEERKVEKKWAWISAGLLAAAILCLMGYAKSVMAGAEPSWMIFFCVFLIASQAVRIVKLRCPYCGKSVAPLRLTGGDRLICPRCGRFYEYEK